MANRPRIIPVLPAAASRPLGLCPYGTVLQAKSPDLGLSNAKEMFFIYDSIPLLLKVNHQREVFCQATLPRISDSTDADDTSGLGLLIESYP